MSPKKEVKPKYRGMEGTYVISDYTEVQCSCGNFVAFRNDSTLINATMCPKCNTIIDRPQENDPCKKNG
jgi:hypothetical protein